MSLPLPLHPSRMQVLYALRHSPRARYTELMRFTGLESDVFKFHLRVLIKNQLVSKNSDGSYSLTAEGKEFANNLDEKSGQREHSPKLSMIIIASSRHNGEDVYLFHQRHRTPFYGYWGFLSGPVIWGRSIEECAKEEFLKQTGIATTFHVQGFVRVRDYMAAGHRLLEDKLFAIVTADDVDHVALHDWRGGLTKWMSWSEFTTESKRFDMTAEIFSHLQQGDTYFEIENEYDPDMY